MEKEMVNHPSHYNQGSMECIDAIVGACGVEEAKVFCKINAFKYLWRLGHKDAEEQEIGKIKWYLDKYVELGSASPYKVNELCGFKVGEVVLIKNKNDELLAHRYCKKQISEIFECDEVAIFHFTDSSSFTFTNKQNIADNIKKL